MLVLMQARGGWLDLAPGIQQHRAKLAVAPRSLFSKLWLFFTRPHCLHGPFCRSRRTEGESS